MKNWFLSLLPAGFSGGAAAVMGQIGDARSSERLVVAAFGVLLSIGAFIVQWRVAQTKINANKSLDQVNRLQIQEIENRLCFDCRSGKVPKVCPIPLADRPVDCPHQIKQ